MQDWNSLWRGSAAADGNRWNPWSPFELQVQMWNRFLDASRGFWTQYAAAMPPMPWLPQAGAERRDAEPAATPDPATEAETALEAQVRLWNHMLDANRSFWTPFLWTVPDLPDPIRNADTRPATPDRGVQPIEAPRRAAKRTQVVTEKARPQR